MIVINAIKSGAGSEEKMIPERELTSQEKQTVIYAEIYDDKYHYFQTEDQAAADSRLEARRKLDEDRASKLYGTSINNPNYAANVALYNSLLDMYPDDQILALQLYVEQKHPDIEILP